MALFGKNKKQDNNYSTYLFKYHDSKVREIISNNDVHNNEERLVVLKNYVLNKINFDPSLIVHTSTRLFLEDDKYTFIIAIKVTKEMTKQNEYPKRFLKKLNDEMPYNGEYYPDITFDNYLDQACTLEKFLKDNNNFAKKAKITFISTEKGGRRDLPPIGKLYSPEIIFRNCDFEDHYKGFKWSARLYPENDENPMKVDLSYLYPEIAPIHLIKPNYHFQFIENNKVVANGIILSKALKIGFSFCDPHNDVVNIKNRQNHAAWTIKGLFKIYFDDILIYKTQSFPIFELAYELNLWLNRTMSRDFTFNSIYDDKHKFQILVNQDRYTLKCYDELLDEKDFSKEEIYETFKEMIEDIKIRFFDEFGYNDFL